jgi:hypothetical protein
MMGLGALPTQYRDTVLVQRGGESTGHRDPTTGFWIVDDEEAWVATFRANVQAGGLLMASRRSTSTTFADADGQFSVHKRDLARLLELAPGDQVHITYATLRKGTTMVRRGADAEVLFVRPEDRTALLRYK